MQKITIITSGKLKEKFYLDAQQEYLKRLQKSCELTLIELPEQKLSENPSEAEIQKGLEAEAKAMMEKIPKGSAIVAMCIEGKTIDSVGLSEKMQEFANSGKSNIAFLIGSSFGLSDSLKAMADWKLSMSPMTFPHHLARIMLLEQIYRAYQIQMGTKYHK